MREIGNEAEGFSVNGEPKEKRICVVGWGFWSVEVALSFYQAVCLECWDLDFDKHLTLDMTRLKPMRDEGQAAIVQLTANLGKLRIVSVSVETRSELTKLQFLRLVKVEGGSIPVSFI